MCVYYSWLLFLFLIMFMLFRTFKLDAIRVILSSLVMGLKPNSSTFKGSKSYLNILYDFL